jgi:hypothetical protein
MEELQTYKLKRNGIQKVIDSIKGFFKKTSKKLSRKKEEKKDDDIGFETY